MEKVDGISKVELPLVIIVANHTVTEFIVDVTSSCKVLYTDALK